jgi:signal peptidase I
MKQTMHQGSEAQDTQEPKQEPMEEPKQGPKPEPEQEPKQEPARKPEKKYAKQKRAVLFFLCKLVVLVLVIWAVFTFVFGLRQVSGEAMYPMLRDGDLILFYRMENAYQIDDVVAFQRSEYTFTARIVAQGGDVVDLTEDGKLVVNGNIKDEDVFYATDPAVVNDDIEYPYTVAEDSYFVLSDYRIAGFDSRNFGAIAEKDLDGKVITVLRRRGI